MLLPTTHIAFGALSAVFASLILKVKLTQTMFIGGMIFAFLPDFDYLFYLVRFGLRPAKYSHEHRLIWTHSLLPHFILSLIITQASGRKKNGCSALSEKIIPILFLNQLLLCFLSVS